MIVLSPLRGNRDCALLYCPLERGEEDKSGEEACASLRRVGERGIFGGAHVVACWGSPLSFPILGWFGGEEGMVIGGAPLDLLSIRYKLYNVLDFLFC